MTEEQSEANGAADAVTEDKRERSTIEFPYLDMDDAVEIAKAIHANAGVSCTLDQLAAYLKVSMTSGAFRLRTANARTYGLTENERGSLTLTDLGRRIADPSQEPAARVESFLHVALFKRIFENYRGYTLPPASALEKFIREAGVAAKQTGKARQAFVRAARQAGFFAHGEDRLVRPAITEGGPGTKPIEVPPPPEERRGGGGGGGDDVGLDLDPLLIELLKKIPTTREGWPEAKRLRWFRTFAMNVSEIYDTENEPVEMQISVVHAGNGGNWNPGKS